MQRYIDKRRRKVFKENEYLIVSLKFLLNNKKFITNKNFINNLYNSNMNIFLFLQQNSLNKIKNYCVITNRSRSILKEFKISRIVLRNYASKGYIMGLHRSSW